MQIKYGNMWNAWETSDLFLISTNGSLTNTGKLVMGRGIAKEARDRVSGIDKVLGKAIQERAFPQGLSGGRCYFSEDRNAFVYHLLVQSLWPMTRLGLFQVKYRFMEMADLNLITESARQLGQWCAANPEARVALNFPGIGYGHRGVDEVLPIIQKLPDSVTVYRFSKDDASDTD